MKAVLAALATAASLAWAAVLGLIAGQSGQVHMFAGSQDAWAMTEDRTGANLPPEYAPWRFVESFDKSDAWFRVGRDKATMAEVEAKGYSVSFITVSMLNPNF